jgi:hypothetical protein
MPENPTIGVTDIELGAEITLWDVMRATLRAKEARPNASVHPAVLVLKSQEVVAEIYQSCEEPRTPLIHTVADIHKIHLNWNDVLHMLHRTSFYTLKKMKGTAVILFGERMEDSGRATVYAMKWTARQFFQQPPRGAQFPETNDTIFQRLCLENEKVHWISEVNTALQFSF